MKSAGITNYKNREELEIARLKEAFQSTYTERFYTLMKLIKVSSMISNAKIISSPKIPNQT